MKKVMMIAAIAGLHRYPANQKEIKTTTLWTKA